jgi:hypothetical protein
MIGAEGDAFLAWHDVEIPPKNPRRLRDWLHGWQQETGLAVAGRLADKWCVSDPLPVASLRGCPPS